MKTLGLIIFGGWWYLSYSITGDCQSGIRCGSPAYTFRSVEPAINQIVISEIMADPDPVVGLPNAEYLELFNRGESLVSLTGCRLIIGKKEKILPDVTLASNAYLIVCDAGDENLFIPLGKTIFLEHMSPVLNSGATITLRSISGKVLFSVEFSDRWYRSREKAGGGWSLEMIDMENFCGRADNWSESEGLKGGTPGSRNSVAANNPDKQKPKLLRATLNTDTSVLLHFNESMDRIPLSDPSFYSADHNLFHPMIADPVEPGFTSVVLRFGTRLSSGITYTLTALDKLNDCAGNRLDYNALVRFGIPEEADSLDVVFNELLFDTPSSFSEFIELYNRSEKTIELAEFYLALCDPFSDSITRKTVLKDNSFLLFPDHYVALTRRQDLLPDLFNRLYLSNVIELPALFTLPDRDGVVALISSSRHVIDRFRYSQRMHSAFLHETEGISLERIRADQPTNDFSNWYSASSLSGYATPGAENSQGLSSTREITGITISPAVFSPDGDGTDEVTDLILVSGGPGFMANVRIFDIQGRTVKILASQELLGTETHLVWDGMLQNQTPAEIGIYLIYIELFNQRGVIKKYRKVVTLARKL